MHRYGVLLPICAIIAGFSVAGYVVRASGELAPAASQQAAEAAVDTLRKIPDPMAEAALDALQAVGQQARATAGDAVKAIAALAPILPDPASSGEAGSNRLQAVAVHAAKQLQSLPPPVQAATVSTDPGEIQIAGQSLSAWLSTLAGGQSEPAAPAPKTEIATVTPPAPVPAPQTEVATLALPTPALPAPVVAQVTVAREPAPVAPAPSAAIAANPMTAAPEPHTAGTVVAQAAGGATETPAGASDQENAGTVAKQLNERFNDLMKSLTGSDKPSDSADTAKSNAAETPPADIAATPSSPATGETPAAVAEAASDLVLSALSFAPGADDKGVITLSGRGLPGRKLALFLDDKQVGTSDVAQNGHWLLDVTEPLPLGDHQARADLLGANGKVTHSAIYMFARQAAIVAGGETTIVPLAKMATAPAEPAPAKPAEVAAATPAEPDVIKIIPPDQMEKTTAATPELAPSPAEPIVTVKRQYAQTRAKPQRRLLARNGVAHPHTVVVNVHRGAVLVRVRVPDGLLRVSVAHVLQPRRARHGHPRHAQARKAVPRRCRRIAARQR